MGVIQFEYSLAADLKFYDTIAGLFTFIGAAVLATKTPLIDTEHAQTAHKFQSN